MLNPHDTKGPGCCRHRSRSKHLRLSLNGDIVIDDDFSDERWLSVEDLPIGHCHVVTFLAMCCYLFEMFKRFVGVFFSIRVFVSVNFRPSMGPIFLHAIFIYLQLEVGTGWHKVLPRTPIGSWRQRPIKLERGSKTSGAMAAMATATVHWFTGWIGWRGMFVTMP